MLDQATRAAILQLHKRGYHVRKISRDLKVSRDTVKKVLKLGTDEVPSLSRAEIAAPYRDQILELYYECKQNLVRVHEELTISGIEMSYQALTAFCRRNEIGHEPKQPSGRYHFLPGEEMQHDTSEIGTWSPSPRALEGRSSETAPASQTRKNRPYTAIHSTRRMYRSQWHRLEY